MPRAEPAATAESVADRLEPLLDGSNDEGVGAKQPQGGSSDCEEDGWSPDGLCIVCFEGRQGTALRCGHDDFCATCVAKFDNCPLCREPTGRVRPAAEAASPGSGHEGQRRRRLRHGDLMRHRGSATCFAAVVVLMVYTLLLFILDTVGVDIRCRGLPLAPGGESEATCIEEFGSRYGQCVHGMCLMAPAYVLSGCSDKNRRFCGTYLRIENKFCEGAPVYLKNGQSEAEVLFRLPSPDENEFSDATSWAVGLNRETIDNCGMRREGGSIYYQYSMLSSASNVPQGPAYIGYLPWIVPQDSRVLVTPSDGRSVPQGLCKGVDCGNHSYCTMNQNEVPVCKCKGNRAGTGCERSCGKHGTSNGYNCSCRDGYIGLFCEVALPPGFNNSYALTGCPVSPHLGTAECESECLCGNFTRTLRTCDGVPTYWRSPDDNAPLPPGVTDYGASLFRFTFNNRSAWTTSSMAAAEACNPFYKAGLQSTEALLPLPHPPAPNLEMQQVGPGLVGAPDDPAFKPWSKCNYAGQCFAMRGFEITAI